MCASVQVLAEALSGKQATRALTAKLDLIQFSPGLFMSRYTR